MWLTVLFSALLLILILLYSPIKIKIKYKEQLSVKVYYLFFFYTISPQKKKKKTKKRQVQRDNKFRKMVKDNGFIKTFENIRNYILPIIDILKKFEENIVVKPFIFNLTMVSDDAAKLAVDYGKFCSVFYSALSYLNTQISIEKIKTNIRVDYLKTNYEFYFETTIRFKLIFLLNYLSQVMSEIHKLKDKSKNTKERVVNE